MEQNSRFLIKYMGDNCYDDGELSSEGVLDVICEEAGSFRFTDGWKDDVWSEIGRIKVGEEYDVYGQAEYCDLRVFSAKRII